MAHHRHLFAKIFAPDEDESLLLEVMIILARVVTLKTVAGIKIDCLHARVYELGIVR